jgi:hypothetical protein
MKLHPYVFTACTNSPGVDTRHDQALLASGCMALAKAYSNVNEDQQN